MAKYDIVSLGESLLDFVMLKGKPDAKISLEGNAGGAPANVLAAAAKLGRKTAYISRVGADPFGEFFIDRLAETGVDVSGIVKGPEPTTLAMVALDKRGDRSFRFYRGETADVMLKESEVRMELVTAGRVFHFGTLSMAAEPVYSATISAVKKAREAGAAISFDPNYRPVLWKDEKSAVAVMEEGIALADYVKVSEEEAEMLTGEKDPEKAALQLLTKYDLHFVVVTLGPKGCVGLSPKARVRMPTFDLPTVDTTGAGDAFWGAALHRLLAYRGSGGVEEKAMGELLKYANAAGSLVTTQYGAVPALATEEQILRCVEKERFLQVE